MWAILITVVVVLIIIIIGKYTDVDCKPSRRPRFGASFPLSLHLHYSGSKATWPKAAVLDFCLQSRPLHHSREELDTALEGHMPADGSLMVGSCKGAGFCVLASKNIFTCILLRGFMIDLLRIQIRHGGDL